MKGVIVGLVGTIVLIAAISGCGLRVGNKNLLSNGAGSNSSNAREPVNTLRLQTPKPLPKNGFLNQWAQKS
jgi:hypothetical protein